ncbi:MAG: AI-2E family transporter [Thermoguttaceae bacterium]|jgi:AI-2 transport protein TqsA|nr:AI-2E family transporter [Thermoguttaceae bacterium]
MKTDEERSMELDETTKKKKKSSRRRERPSALLHYAAIGASIIVILGGIHAVRGVLGPVFLAAFFTVLLIQPVNWLKRKGIRSWLALWTVIIVVAVLGLGTMSVVCVEIAQFAKNIPNYHERFTATLHSYNLDLGIFIPGLESKKPQDGAVEEKAPSVDEKGGGAVETDFASQPLDAGSETDDEHAVSLADAAPTFKSEPISAVDASSRELFRLLGSLARELSSLFSSAFLITLLVIFMLYETEKIPRKLLAAIGPVQFANAHIKDVVADVRKYMVVKTFVSVVNGVLVTILCLSLGVQYSVLWGFISFLFNYIPNIGSVVAAIPPILLALIDRGLFGGVVTAVFFILINGALGYWLEPRLFGDGLDLSPLIVLVALIFFGWLLGPVGMFLSPPLAVVSKIILQSFPETRWIAALMANKAEKPLGDETPAEA